MKVALGQFAPTSDSRANLAIIESLATAAASAGAELIVFPEYAAWFDPAMATGTYAEPLTGTAVGAVRQTAHAQSIAIVFGMLEHAAGRDPARPFNTLVAIDRRGQIMSTYRKVHLYDAFGAGESSYLSAGEPQQSAAFEVGDLTFGLQTCFDLRFPESARQRIDEGAEVLVVPAQWVPGPLKDLHWHILNQARAIENVAYVIGVGQPEPAGIGASLVVEPTGNVLVEARQGEKLVIAELDRELLKQLRQANPCLEMRRFVVSAAP